MIELRRFGAVDLHAGERGASPILAIAVLATHVVPRRPYLHIR